MAHSQPEINVGGKLFVAILVALLLGYLWACFDKDRSPLDILKLISIKEPDSTPQPIVKDDPIQRSRDRESPEREDPSRQGGPGGSRPFPRSHSPTEMDALFASIDEALHHGRIPEAKEKIRSTNKLLIPEDSLERFRRIEGRVEKYCALLVETTKGGLIEMPLFWELVNRETKSKLIVKGLSRKGGVISCETLTGIRSALREGDWESCERLDPFMVRIEVREELRRQAVYKGLEAFTEPGGPMTYKEKPGREVKALEFFNLADFCARNGMNDEIVPLFDEGLRRDTNLPTTVREAKAERLLNVFLYFVGTRAYSNAEEILEIIKDRYADTRTYREKIDGDDEIRKLIQELHLLNPEEGLTNRPPPEILPGRLADLVAIGDRFFKEAMEHMFRSDQNVNPEGWAEENRKALELFLKANHEGYLPAQELFETGRVPQYLLDKVRETQKNAWICRKLSHSSRD